MATCLAVTVPTVAILFVGSVLGGLRSGLTVCSTKTIRTDLGQRRLAQKSGRPETTNVYMAYVHVTVGIVAGVLGDWLVFLPGTRKASVWTSSMLLPLLPQDIRRATSADSGMD